MKLLRRVSHGIDPFSLRLSTGPAIASVSHYLSLSLSLCRASESPSLSSDEHGVAWILTCAPKSPVTLSRQYTTNTRCFNPPTPTSTSSHRLTRRRWAPPSMMGFLVEGGRPLIAVRSKERSFNLLSKRLRIKHCFCILNTNDYIAL